MKLKIVLLIFLGAAALVRADDTIAQAQQSLKDQGFYYGDITGEKNADTLAAIRRYQIRNGLQVTGELNSETMRSLGSNATQSAESTARVSPPPRPNTSERADESQGETEVAETPYHPPAPRPQNDGSPQAPPGSFSNAPIGPPVYPSSPATVVPPSGGLFAGTPYATAPPDVQRDLVASAQRLLERRELYRGEIDGIFGPNLEFSLRAYQSRVVLPVTGRLDLETLAGLNLLPGARMPGFNPHRRVVRPRPDQPVVGEWIRE